MYCVQLGLLVVALCSNIYKIQFALVLLGWHEAVKHKSVIDKLSEQALIDIVASYSRIANN